MSFLPPTRRLLLPVMVVSQALPVFAIAPLLALWFGFGLASKIVMATIAIFFPVASAYHDGLARTDPQLLDLARLYGASRVAGGGGSCASRRRCRRSITGIRLAAVYAPIGALIGEWVGASSGLGYAMLHGQWPRADRRGLRRLFLLAAMSVLLRAVVDLLTRNLTPWAPETDTERTEDRHAPSPSSPAALALAPARRAGRRRRQAHRAPRLVRQSRPCAAGDRQGGRLLRARTASMSS